MSVLEDIEKQVNDMLESRNKELDSLETAITKDEIDAKTARDLMTAATDAGDLTSYQKAKAKLNNATDSLEMHTSRRDKLSRDPLISKTEYTQICKELTDAMDAEVAESIPKLAKATEDLEAIGDGVKKDADRTNDLLRKIQAHLYKNQDRQKRADGQFVDSPRSYKGHFNVVEWSREASNGETYKQYKRKQEVQKQKEAAAKND